MGLIVRVKVSHYVCIETNEQDVDKAFDSAETTACENAKADGLENVEIDDMEIIGCTENPCVDEDAIYEERRFKETCGVA